jgi:hypothetical protein
MEAILVMIKTNAFENYKGQYKIFIDADKAVKFAKEKMKEFGLMSPIFPNCGDDLKQIGMMYLSEAGDQYVKIIKLEVED